MVLASRGLRAVLDPVRALRPIFGRWLLGQQKTPVGDDERVWPDYPALVSAQRQAALQLRPVAGALASLTAPAASPSTPPGASRSSRTAATSQAVCRSFPAEASHRALESGQTRRDPTEVDMTVEWIPWRWHQARGRRCDLRRRVRSWNSPRHAGPHTLIRRGCTHHAQPGADRPEGATAQRAVLLRMGGAPRSCVWLWVVRQACGIRQTRARARPCRPRRRGRPGTEPTMWRRCSDAGPRARPRGCIRAAGSPWDSTTSIPWCRQG